MTLFLVGVIIGVVGMGGFGAIVFALLLWMEPEQPVPSRSIRDHAAEMAGRSLVGLDGVHGTSDGRPAA